MPIQESISWIKIQFYKKFPIPEFELIFLFPTLHSIEYV